MITSGEGSTASTGGSAGGSGARLLLLLLLLMLMLLLLVLLPLLLPNRSSPLAEKVRFISAIASAARACSHW